MRLQVCQAAAVGLLLSFLSSCDSEVDPAFSAPIGSRCSSTADCGSNRICVAGSDFPHSICTQACERSSCGEEASCVVLSGGSFCLSQCKDAGDCQPDFSCATLTGAAKPVCAPKEIPPLSTPVVCPAPLLQNGGVIGPASEPAGCVAPIQPINTPAATVIALGIHDVGDDVTFTVPAGSRGVAIVMQAQTALDTVVLNGQDVENFVLIDRLRTPLGVFFDLSSAYPADVALARFYVATLQGRVSVFGLPNTAAALNGSSGLPGGAWTFTVEDYAHICSLIQGCSGGAGNGAYDISVVIKSGISEPATLDLGLYWLSQDSGLNAASAMSNTSVARALSTLRNFYAKAGICLGTITFYDGPTWARDKYAEGIDGDETAPCDNLNQMFTLSQPGNRLNIFLVDSIQSSLSGGFVLAGLDGAIPGPPGLAGTVHTGAVVSLADLSAGTCGSSIDLEHCGADSIGYIIAHEGGHWLGLYHTTEATGETFDPLVDTATCNCRQCLGAAAATSCGSSSGPQVVSGSCNTGNQICGGAGNLMFWLVNQDSLGQLSAQQKAVMLSHSSME